MKYLIYSILVMCCLSCEAQEQQQDQALQDGYISEIITKRKEANNEFKGDGSPLTDKDKKKFVGLAFYPPNEKYKVQAKLTLTPDAQPFKMKTTTDRKPVYQQFGILKFVLDGEEFFLPSYINVAQMAEGKLDPYLFIPFADNTNGESTYGGGRYLDIPLPKAGTKTVEIDFNLAYNPYCAYNKKYSCPKIPKENILPIKIEAGVKAFH